MSIEAVAWAAEAVGLTAAAKLTLILVADGADMDGRLFEPFDRVIFRTNLTAEAFDAAVGELTAAGLAAYSMAPDRAEVTRRCIQLFVEA